MLIIPLLFPCANCCGLSILLSQLYPRHVQFLSVVLASRTYPAESAPPAPPENAYNSPALSLCELLRTFYSLVAIVPTSCAVPLGCLSKQNIPRNSVGGH